MANPTDSGTKTKSREWSPRQWEGADYFAWLKLLARNRFAVEPGYLYIAGIVSGVTFANTVLGWLQNGIYGSRIAKTKLPEDPIFVIGHWRTGTTLLHELLILDDRHTYPDTYDCFVPRHNLISESFFKNQLSFLMPHKRPMDNMVAGWDRPQEDEFALCLLGQPSTYTDVAFPNHPSNDPNALDLSGLSHAQKQAWKRTLLRFVQTITYKDPRRIVLKSPPHTARIPILLELFPNARFVHITRDPYVLYASTLNLWKTLAKRHGLQTLRHPELLEDKVLREYRIIHERYEEAKAIIPAGRLVEVRYEEFIKDMLTGTEAIYDGLNLGNFAQMKPKLVEYLAKHNAYETNKYPLSDADRARVKTSWGDIIAKLGYDSQ